MWHARRAAPATRTTNPFQADHLAREDAPSAPGYGLCCEPGVLARVTAGALVMVVCVTIHAGGLTWALRLVRRQTVLPEGFWRSTGLFIAIAGWIVLLHILEIAVWGGLYLSNGALTDYGVALYFSAVTYTTTGYGDVVLAPGWRMESAIEALTGILMCGWSTGFFFAMVNRLYEPHR